MTAINDPVEREIASALDDAGIEYVHESDGAALDFYLPAYGLHIEACRFHTPRKIAQLGRADDVILAQGMKAAAFLAVAIRGKEMRND